jgi:protein-disulfide isomerase
MSVLLHTPRLTLPVSERDHVRGPPTAAVTLVEYGDYECPYCGAAHPIVRELERLLGHDMRFAYRHFPLSRIHPHAYQAAEAAEAAGAQGRFWELHDLLFTHQDRLSTPDLLAYAEELELDLRRFVADLEGHSGIRSGVNGTPTFFVNGVRHNGGYDLESLLEAIRAAV